VCVYLYQKGTCTLSQVSYAIENNGVKISYPDDGSCELDMLMIPGLEGTYRAIQLHTHLSSEHTVDGMFYGAELHVVHVRDDGERLSVVGVLLSPGLHEDHEGFGAMLAGWEQAADDVEEACTGRRRHRKRRLSHGADERRMQELVDAYGLLVEGNTFYQYAGSLTTPPCSEIVDWNFSPEQVLISVTQYQALVDLTLNAMDAETCELKTIASPQGSTSRPVLPLNGREVRHICMGIEDEPWTPPRESDEEGQASDKKRMMMMMQKGKSSMKGMMMDKGRRG
jgi:carbonic anhydrase